MSTTMYNHLSKEEMIVEAEKLLSQVKTAAANVPPEISEFIRNEASKALTEGRGTDTAIYFDVSGSMSHNGYVPWNTQRDIVKAIIPTAKEYDAEGIDMIAIIEENPMEEGRMPKVTDVDVAMKFVDKFRNELRGSTPTRQLYQKDMKARVNACIKDPDNTKRLNSVIVTDGEPSDYAYPSMTQTTEWATLKLEAAGLSPKDYLGISYAIVTTNFHIMACYRKMENRTVWGSGEKQVECDMSNAIYPFIITALGGANQEIVIDIILAANKSDALDRAAEKLLHGVPKRLTDLMDAYINKGYANEV